jgi:hypothetical protein
MNVSLELEKYKEITDNIRKLEKAAFNSDSSGFFDRARIAIPHS